MLDRKIKYLQIAFNDDLADVERILPEIPRSGRILIEAGTPFIKREGFGGIRRMKQLWGGDVIADLKTADGALEEVQLAAYAGASGATVLGSASTETMDLFIATCKSLNVISMIDMIGVEEPLKVVMKLKHPPDVVILHKGRDEESTRGKVIQYKHINKVLSKYNVLISAAGGIDLHEASSAVFNGANIIIVNIVTEADPWTGIESDSDVTSIAEQFLKTID
jgi:bifunctional enzyme Fae/Hps